MTKKIEKGNGIKMQNLTTSKKEEYFLNIQSIKLDNAMKFKKASNSLWQKESWEVLFETLFFCLFMKYFVYFLHQCNYSILWFCNLCVWFKSKTGIFEFDEMKNYEADAK